MKSMFMEPQRDYTYSLVAINQIKNYLIQLKRSYEGFAVHASKATVRYDYEFSKDLPNQRTYPKDDKEKKDMERKLREEPQEQEAVSSPPRRRGQSLFDMYFER